MQEIAYVDDIESSTFSSTAMQRKADIVSAFCILTGIQLSHTKLRRSFTARVHTDSMEFTPEFKAMTIYTAPWTPEPIKVKHDQYTEYLGIKNDLQGQPFVSQFSDTCAQLKLFIHQITTSSASARIKLDVLTKSVYPAIQYQMRIANYPFKQYGQLDELLYPLIRHITHTPPGFPYALLQLPSRHVGIGIPRLSYQIQYSKLGILLRSLHAPTSSPHHIAITSMLSRQASIQHTPLATNQSISLNITNPSPNWLLSLLQWMDIHKLQLCRQGTSIPTITSECESHASLFQKWNIHYVQDILHSSSCHAPLSLPPQLKSLQHLVNPHYPDLSPTVLRRRQLWKLPDLTSSSEPILTDKYAEILGWESTSHLIHIQEWQSA